MIQELKINEKSITYSLTRKNVKNINIRIKTDGIIYVSANKSVSIKYIEKVLKENSDYILNALEKVKKDNLSEPTTITSIKFLGKIYPVIFETSENEHVEFSNYKFILYLKEKTDYEQQYFMVNKWYSRQCLELYDRINREVSADYNKRNFKVPLAFVTIKHMKTRWGSCNIKNNKISINLKLIKYPTECIYAVFYHEYSHFFYQDHSKNFYRFLNLIYPEYKKWDRVLKKK
ncbi:MAG: M48 family metallopeptidase [Pleomorphochaeta sp.]